MKTTVITKINMNNRNTSPLFFLKNDRLVAKLSNGPRLSATRANLKTANTMLKIIKYKIHNKNPPASNAKAPIFSEVNILEISIFIAPGTIKIIPTSESKPKSNSARNMFTRFFFPASLIADKLDFPDSVACIAIPIAPEVKYAWMKKTSRTIITTMIAISIICCPMSGSRMETTSSGLLAFSMFNKEEPKIPANPKLAKSTTSRIEIKKLRIKGMQILRFFVYVSKPLLMIFPISSTIFIYPYQFYSTS
ncbi:MAG: hypothetical protein WA130_05150 [Candidatus Methanoperedens sp.]